METNIERDDLVAGMKRLLVTSKYSDLVIKCGTTILNVHRSIVCTRSPVLAAICDANEAEARTIVLDREDPAVVMAMIEFLYTSDYNIPRQSKLSAKAIHALLYLAADAYEIKSLRASAKNKFESVENQPWLLSDIPSTVRGVYAAKLPRNHVLKDSLVKMIHANFEMLMMDDTYLTLLDDVAGLGLDVLKAEIGTKHKTAFETQRWQCAACKEIFHFPVGVPWYCALCGSPKPKKVG